MCHGNLTLTVAAATYSQSGKLGPLCVYFLLCWLFSFHPASAATPYQMQNVMLLQPDFVLSNRLNSPLDLANYIKSIGTAAETALSGASAGSSTPSAGFIVMAVRPGGMSKVWFDFSPVLPPSLETQLRGSLQKVVPFSVKNGVVVFAISASLWGAAPTSQQGPRIAEWQQAVKQAGRPLEIDDILDRVWPLKPGP